MIRTEQLAEWLEAGLNDNDKGIVFKIEANHNDFNTAVYNRERYEIQPHVYGTLRNLTSEAEPIKDLGNAIVTTELTLVVGIGIGINFELIDVYSILERYYEFNLGSVDKIGDYTIVLDIQVPSPDQTRIDNLGETIVINMPCTFSIIKNAITFNETSFFIDGTEMTQILSWNLNNSKTQEKFNPTTTNINKNYFSNQTLVLSIIVPHLKVSWLQTLFNNHYVEREQGLNKVYEIKYEDPNHKGLNAIVYKMTLVDMPISAEPGKANGVAITFAEVLDEE